MKTILIKVPDNWEECTNRHLRKCIANGELFPKIIGRWTPVSEGMPEDGEWAIFTDGKHKSIERYKEDALDHFYPDGRWFELEDAVAWMPLPEDYKEDAHD